MLVIIQGMVYNGINSVPRYNVIDDNTKDTCSTTFHTHNFFSATSSFSKNTGRHPLVESLISNLSAEPDSQKRVSMVTAFFRDVSLNGTGMPLAWGNSYTFLYLQEWGKDEPLRVSGDFNSWSSSGVVMSRCIDSFWLWEAVINITPGSSRIIYKFVAKDSSTGSDIWFPDANARLYGFDQFGEYSVLRQGNRSALGRVLAFKSQYLNNERQLRYYLPPGYDNNTGLLQPARGYPTVYMHDGQNLFDPSGPYGSWLVQDVADSLISRNLTCPFIVVGIDNAGSGRLDEYGQVQDYIEELGGLVGGKAPLYARFVTEEVMPWVRAHLNTMNHRLGTATLGSSMGGLISLYLLLY
ncbi:MAG: alpha/beta hydrolase-fold protein, partial [Thermoplasmata archaeon]